MYIIPIPNLLHTRLISLVQHVEVHGLRARGRKKQHREINELLDTILAR